MKATGYALKAKGSTVAWQRFPLTADTFAREFETEREAEVAMARIPHTFNGRRVTLSGVIAPQRHNGFYPAFVVTVEVL